MSYLEIVSVASFYSEEVLRPITFRKREFDLKPGTIFDLGGMEVRVGRGFENDLVIPLSNVSRFHFRLYREGDFYVYEDIGSRQTPIYNDTLIPSRESRVVTDNDTFNAAGVMFRYRKALQGS
jgi:hypothetical protein